MIYCNVRSKTTVYFIRMLSVIIEEERRNFERRNFLYSLYLAVSERTDRGDRRRRKVKPDKDAWFCNETIIRGLRVVSQIESIPMLTLPPSPFRFCWCSQRAQTSPKSSCGLMKSLALNKKAKRYARSG